MIISGIVFKLDADAHAAEAAIRILRTDPRLTLGHRYGPSLPAVLETTDSYQGKRAVEELSEIEGVLRVDVVFVDLVEPQPSFDDRPHPAFQTGRA